MKALGIIILLCVSTQAAEVWLTKERTAQLNAITSRPYITRKVKIGKGVEELQWTNGSRSWVTTQAVRRVAGAKAAHGWQKKLDVEKAARKEIAEKVARKEIDDNIKALATRGSVVFTNGTVETTETYLSGFLYTSVTNIVETP